MMRLYTAIDGHIRVVAKKNHHETDILNNFQKIACL